MLSEDRIVLVNKIDEEYIITLKQKDSDDKCVVFTANRLVFSPQFVTICCFFSS